MNKEAKKDSFGQSRLRPGEEFGGNFPIERIRPDGGLDESGVNYKVQKLIQSGKYEYVRTDQAVGEDGETKIGERAIIKKKKDS